MSSSRLLAAALAALVCCAALDARAAATITIVNGDAAGIGFNDTTPTVTVGGNTGTTLGQQRLIAFQAAANKWGATLTSVVTIRVLATWEALSCTATGAVLGSAGAAEVFSDFTGAPTANRFYSKAEANALAGVELDSTMADIRARFNINLGGANCLTGTFFYLGLDNNHGTDVDLVTVLTHEFAHGLGFQTYTNAQTGAELSAGIPSAFDDFLFDQTSHLAWSAMTNAQRAASAINTGKLVWTGSNVTSAAGSVLAAGTPQLNVSAPASVAGTYLVGIASFGALLASPGVSGEVMPVVDTFPNLGFACDPLSTLNAAAVNGKIALVDRGTCGFTVKAKNVQDAGAIAVIIADNVAGSPPGGLGGTDPTVTIPAVRITLADGNTLRAALSNRSRLASGMLATIGVNNAVLQGADAGNHVWMFAPNPFQSGSSVSHYDVSAFPNLLMEPAINADLTHEVTPPQDLTYPLLKDLGWN